MEFLIPVVVISRGLSLYAKTAHTTTSFEIIFKANCLQLHLEAILTKELNGKTLVPVLDQPNKKEILHNSLTAIY